MISHRTRRVLQTKYYSDSSVFKWALLNFHGPGPTMFYVIHKAICFVFSFLLMLSDMFSHLLHIKTATSAAMPV